MGIRVLVNGAFGRMGQITVAALSKHPDFELVGQTGRGYDLAKAIKDSQAEVVVDFTHPQSVYQNTLTTLEAHAHPVIGTTGLSAEQIKELQIRSAKLKLGGIVAPNFSLGAILMMKQAQAIAKHISHVEIVEMHHDDKADSPSGTAIRTAELIAESCPTINQPQKTTRATLKGARGADLTNIPIHSIRLPGLLAHETIIFGNTGETLTLRHDITDRACFMPGVILACKEVLTLDQLVYGLEEILG